MAQAFTKIPATTFQELQINAGVVVKNFDPANPAIENSDILFATSGGLQFTAEPSYTDYGEDIDNCPTNMLELKRIDSIEVKLAGTALTMTPEIAKMMAGAADIDGTDARKIIPRSELTTDDFVDVWWIGDYGTSGFIAIHLKNTLNTGGLSIQSNDKGKGQFEFELTAHYSMSNQGDVPYELYVSTTTTPTTPTTGEDTGTSGTGTDTQGGGTEGGGTTEAGA